MAVCVYCFPLRIHADLITSSHSLIWAVVSIAMSRLTLRMENIKSQVISQIHPDDTKGGYLVASLDSGESSPTFVWSQ